MTHYQRYRFFKDHAGYVTPPGAAANANALASAEEWRELMEGEGLLTVEWVPDEVGSQFNEGNPPDGYWGCVLSLDGKPAASLWGIDVRPPHPYCRVVEAELASELMDAERERLANQVLKI
jgi:hypothetical protein